MRTFCSLERNIGVQSCDGNALGFCYRNNVYSGSGHRGIVVVQEIGAQHNAPLKSVHSLVRNIAIQMYVMVTH